MARVLYVSKPIAAPFHDGSKCLVRDVATSLRGHQPEVMTIQGTAPLQGAQGEIVHHGVYSRAGSFTPAVRDNLAAAWWLATRAKADLWHYVFAPNLKTSALARWLKKVRPRPTVQTIASAPRSFRRVEELLFGDVVVAQSEHTARAVALAYESESIPEVRRRRVVTVPPPVPALAPPSSEEIQEARGAVGAAPHHKLLLFPGDMETGGGATRVAEWAQRISAELPEALVVFAYRRKSPRSGVIAQELQAKLRGLPVCFTDDVKNMHALLAATSVVLFPVDDLWGKVDLPIVLLEAMALGVPVLALRHGPLAELEGARLLPEADSELWCGEIAQLASEGESRTELVAAQRDAVKQRYSASVVASCYEALYEQLGV